MREVTDPALLEKLNARELKEVTDPDLLKRLNSKDESVGQKALQDIGGVPSSAQKGVRYGIQDPLIGLLNLGHRGATSLSNLIKGKEESPYDFSEMLGVPENQKNFLDKLMQFAPEAATAMALPETQLGRIGEAINMVPRFGKYLKTALGNAISQGLFAASQSPNEQGKAGLEAAAVAAPFSAFSEAIKSGNPAIRNIGRLLGGIGGGGLGYYGAKSVGAPEPAADLAAFLGAALGGKGGSTERRVRENVLKGVEGTPYQEAVDAANRLGLKYITPAEASGNPFTGGEQGIIGKTPQGAQMLFKAGEERAASEKGAINNLLDTIFKKEKLEPKVKSLYESAYPKKVPEEKLSQLQDNEVFKRALKMVQNKSAFKESLKGVPENSVAYLDHIKQAMDDLIEKAPSKEGRIIQKARNELIDITDKAAPEYQQARQLAQREITRRNIEDIFNKKPMTGTNFGKFLNDEKQYRGLQSKFKKLETESADPQYKEEMKSAQQQLADMKLIFHRLINIPTAKTAEALSRTNMSKERSRTQKLARQFNELLSGGKYDNELLSGGKYDKAAVELITNPKWTEELEKLKTVTKKDKLIAAFHDLIGKAGAQAVAQ